MKRLLYAVSVVGLLSSSTAAHAVSITNRDEQDRKVTVIEGVGKVEHLLKSSQTLDGICPKGCIIRLGDSDDDSYRLQASDVVSIEDGGLFYDGPDGQSGQSPSRPTGAKPGGRG